MMEVRLRMRPKLPSIMPGMKARAQRNGPFRLVEITWLHSGNVQSLTGFEMMTPALLMRMPGGPSCSRIWPAVEATAPSSVTSRT